MAFSGVKGHVWLVIQYCTDKSNVHMTVRLQSADGGCKDKVGHTQAAANFRGQPSIVQPGANLLQVCDEAPTLSVMLSLYSFIWRRAIKSLEIHDPKGIQRPRPLKK